MIKFKSNFLQTLQDRDFINQATDLDNLDQRLTENKITAYIGFDCTAKSLHIGSLIQIMMLRLLQKNGHQPIILLGGGTTKIGDPSGKDKSRQILSENDINSNLEGIKKSLEKFDLSKEDPSLPKFKFVNNEDWLNGLNYIEFLRDIGYQFSINKMLTFESVKNRLDREQNLSFLEFNYLILQSYDFLELNKRFGCNLQIGGSDQWGNIVSGVDLIRRINSQNNKSEDIFGLTSPLLLNSEGKKMGKTADGAVWLDENMLDPFEYFQYFRNVKDEDIIRLLFYFTEISNEKITEYKKLEGQELNKIKEILAFEATKICHGEDVAKDCLQKAQEIFKNKNENAFKEIKIPTNSKLIDVMILSESAPSKSQARKLIASGAVKVNKEKTLDENYIFQEDDVFSVGKKKFFKILLNL
ncbi:tyrosine--tRNA ligase [Rickettsiales bacterium]|nr:tyrosine--tRNA ligase [Rickettsiales bacterium]